MWWLIGVLLLIGLLLQIFWWVPLKNKEKCKIEKLNNELQPKPAMQITEEYTHVSDKGYCEDDDWEKYYKDRNKKLNSVSTYKESYSVRDSYYRDLFLISITDKTLILDTETTGLDEKAEIIEISIIDLKGNVLLDTLIKPKRKIPIDAINIHGITNEMVKDAPKWEDIYKEFRSIVKSADLVLIYNERYDKRLIMQTCRASGVPTPKFSSDCVMKICAQWNGEVKRNGEYMFKSLDYVAKIRKISINGEPHRALTDCNTVRKIIDSFIEQ